MGYFFIVALMGSVAWSAHAQEGVRYTVEPIVSYELQRKSEPSPHTRMVLLYGARATAGYLVFSGELEYTQGESNETFTEPAINILERTHKVRAGVRSEHSFSKGVSSALRGGAEISQRRRTVTQAGSSQTSTVPTRVDPYLGGGIALTLVPKFAITFEGVVTFRDLKDLSQNEYSTSLGVKFTP
jgi:hypothetical protein